MRTLMELDLAAPAVGPSDTLTTAIKVMREAGVRTVAVVAGGELAGLVTLEKALEAQTGSMVRHIVEPVAHEFDGRLPVRTAAKMFVEHQIEAAPVMNGPKFMGILTALNLLDELGHSWDPLTGLSWSDRLRDWGMRHLQAGTEISIAFFDLDDFGAYNKRHGHIVGDRVLKSFAAILSEVQDKEMDVLVRYGGDEFVMGSIRNRNSLEALIQSVRNRELTVEGVPDPVTFSVGFSGGKRSEERLRVHYAATLDNLINLASKDCLSNKLRTQRHEPAPHPEEEPITSPLTAAVAMPEAVKSEAVEEPIPVGAGALDQVVSATVHEIESEHPNVRVRVMDTIIHENVDGGTMVTVLGRCRVGTVDLPLNGSRRVSDNLYRAVAEAIRAAFEAIDLASVESS